jgi:hypothetical protein
MTARRFSMGADFRDIDNDGKPDAVITALSNETFRSSRTWVVFGGRDLFEPIGAAALPWAGWGSAFST